MTDTREEAKQVLLKLIAAAGGQFRGTVRLYKAFYFAHLFHWRDEAGVLSKHPIIRLQHGPAIEDGERLLEELEQENRITITSEDVGPFTDYKPERVFTLTGQFEPDLEDSEFRSAVKAAEFVKWKSGAELSELTHDVSRSWNSAPYKAEMDVYSDLLNPEHFEQIQQAARDAEEQLRALFKR